MYYQTSPVSVRVRSPGPLSSPRRSRSPRVPSSSLYRPVGSPVARTNFPTRRTASTSPSPGTLGIGALLASHPAAGSRELNPAVIWPGSAGRVDSSVVGTSLRDGFATSRSTSPEALLTKSYETIMTDISLHRPIGTSGGGRRSLSPMAAETTRRTRSPQNPHRSVYASRLPRPRSPRVPSSSFYRPVGSPVARTIFPTRRTASTSPSPGTLGIGTVRALCPMIHPLLPELKNRCRVTLVSDASAEFSISGRSAHVLADRSSDAPSAASRDRAARGSDSYACSIFSTRI